jgi:hypothetical protein
MADHIDGPLYYERMGRSGCEMKILYGAGHACQIEQPWLFNRYMIEFLKEHGCFRRLGPAARGFRHRFCQVGVR